VIDVERAQPAEPESSGSSEKAAPRAKGQPAEPKGDSPSPHSRALARRSRRGGVAALDARELGSTQLLDLEPAFRPDVRDPREPDVQEQLSIFAVDQLYANGSMSRPRSSSDFRAPLSRLLLLSRR